MGRVCDALFRGLYDLTHAPIDPLGHLFGAVAEQAAGMCKLDLASGLWADVLELELADQHGQCRVTVGAGFDGCFFAGFIPAVAQHLLAHSQAGCVGDQRRCFNTVQGPAF